MDYILISEKTFDSARKQIKKNQDKKIMFSSLNDDLNRKILEKEKIDILLLNQLERKDFQKQRNSGLNQVITKLAKKKEIIIGINFDEIINTKDKAKAKILARIRQNIGLCNKYKVKMLFISKNHKKDNYDLRALGLVLGMPTWMTKNF